MKRFTLERFLDQKKPFSHLLYILITMFVVTKPVLIILKPHEPESFGYPTNVL